VPSIAVEVVQANCVARSLLSSGLAGWHSPVEQLVYMVYFLLMCLGAGVGASRVSGC
jgi:hypothetical protein